MFNSDIKTVFLKHHNYVCVSADILREKRSKLRDDLGKISCNSIFCNLPTLIPELQDIEIWSPRMCWLRGCYATSCNDIIRSYKYSKYDMLSDPEFNAIRGEIVNFYENILRSEGNLSFEKLYEFILNMVVLLQKYADEDSNPLLSFAYTVYRTLSSCITTNQQTIKLPHAFDNKNKITKDLHEISLIYLLIETIINVTEFYSANFPNISTEIFIIAPDIQLLVFGGMVQQSLHCGILTLMPLNITKINDSYLRLFLGTITAFKHNNPLSKYIDVINDFFPELYADDKNRMARHILIGRKLGNSQCCLQGKSHVTFFCDIIRDQLLCPIHYDIDPDHINISHFLASVFASWFMTNDIPGIVDERTSEILLENECKPSSTTWYDICVYYLSSYMKILGKDVYKHELPQRRITESYQESFVITAAHYFLDDLDIIKVFWMNPKYRNIIPFSVNLFFPLNITEQKQSVYTLCIPDLLNPDADPLKLDINENFELIVVDQHRELSPIAYTFMTYARVEPSIRSYILLFNWKNRYIMSTMFPLLNPSIISIVSVSPSFQLDSDLYPLIANLLKSHGENAGEYIRQIYNRLFPEMDIEMRD